MAIISKSNYVEKESKSTSCYTKFKTLPFTIK